MHRIRRKQQWNFISPTLLNPWDLVELAFLKGETERLVLRKMKVEKCKSLDWN
jgi:hypothetical protein